LQVETGIAHCCLIVTDGVPEGFRICGDLIVLLFCYIFFFNQLGIAAGIRLGICRLDLVPC
jgi:hypothetical protein